MKTEYKNRLGVGLGALLAAGLFSGPALGDTLQEELEAALQTSPVLARERARLEAVRQAEPVAWSELLPQVNLDGNAIANDSRPDQTPARTGNVDTQFVREQHEFWTASLRVSTMVFGSGRVWASTRQARAQVASAVALYQQAVQDFAVELSRAYGNARFARETLAAQEESLANLEEQARFARANLREGFLTRTDVAQAEARVALARSDLARARSRLVQASEAYMRLTGHPPGTLVAPTHVEGLPDDLDNALEIAEEHPELVSALANIRAADAAVDLAASNGRLRVFLESTNSRFDVIGGRDRQVGTARQEYKEQSDDTVNVRVAIPLYSGGATSARTRQQRHLRAAARYELADIQRSVRENVTSSWSDLDATRARLEASRTRLEAAELASRGVRREQQFGQRSMIDVLNQEQERLSARVALAEAERDAMIAERVYAASIGQIAPLLGIEPEPKKGWDIIEAIAAPFQSDAPEAEAGEETEGVTRRATVLEDAPGPRRGLVARPQSFEPVDAQVATTPTSAAPAPAAPLEPERRRGILYAITHPFGLGAEKDNAPEPAAEQPERRSRGLIDAILHPFGLFRRDAS